MTEAQVGTCNSLDRTLRWAQQANSTQSNKNAAVALTKKLAEYGFVLEITRDGSLSRNEEFFAQFSVADLYRLCFRTLEKRHSKSHRSFRRFEGIFGKGRSRDDRPQGSEADGIPLLPTIHRYYDEQIRGFFDTSWGQRLRARELFNMARRERLLLDAQAILDNGNYNISAQNSLDPHGWRPQVREPTPPSELEVSVGLGRGATTPVEVPAQPAAGPAAARFPPGPEPHLGPRRPNIDVDRLPHWVDGRGFGPYAIHPNAGQPNQLPDQFNLQDRRRRRI